MIIIINDATIFKKRTYRRRKQGTGRRIKGIFILNGEKIEGVEKEKKRN